MPLRTTPAMAAGGRCGGCGLPWTRPGPRRRRNRGRRRWGLPPAPSDPSTGAPPGGTAAVAAKAGCWGSLGTAGPGPVRWISGAAAATKGNLPAAGGWRGLAAFPPLLCPTIRLFPASFHLSHPAAFGPRPGWPMVQRRWPGAYPFSAPPPPPVGAPAAPRGAGRLRPHLRRGRTLPFLPFAGEGVVGRGRAALRPGERRRHRRKWRRGCPLSGGFPALL
jgi:hypothetical protein